MSTQPGPTAPPLDPHSGADPAAETASRAVTPGRIPGDAGPGPGGAAPAGAPRGVEALVGALKTLKVGPLDDLLWTAESAIIRRPLTALVAAVAVGYVIGRLIRE